MSLNPHTRQSGHVSGLFIATISLSIVSAAAIAVAVWAFINYIEQKTDVDGKVSVAVTDAKKEQADEDELKFNAREKEPNRQFVGPDDYGRLTFNYPKTWSVYVDKDGTKSSGNYEAYLNPVSVPPVDAKQQYALRVVIENTDYDEIIDDYSSLVEKGDLKSSSVKVGANVGTRFDGKFNNDIRGAAVIYKLRDKTITLRTDADTFKKDFDALIKTIKFNE